MTDHYDESDLPEESHIDDPAPTGDEEMAICEFNAIQTALAMVEQLNQQLSGGNPHVVLMFQQLADVLEAAAWMGTDALQQRDALLEENDRLGTDLAETSGDYQQLINDIMNWQETEDPVIRTFVETVVKTRLRTTELEAIRDKYDQRQEWADAAADVLGDQQLAASFAEYLFEQAPKDPAVIRAIFEVLTVAAN